MATQPVTTRMAVAAVNAMEQNPVPPSKSSPNQVAHSAADVISVTTPSDTRQLYQSLQTDKAALASLARTVQKADTAMTAIGDKIDTMKATLTEVVKNFPPFPPGSEDRLKLLKSFNSLRQEIDSLTFPPAPDYGVRKVLADPATVPASGTVNADLATTGQQVTIGNYQVHTGPTGLDIPPLPDGPGGEATAGQVTDALTKLETATATLGTRQSGLAADAAGLAAAGVLLPKKINVTEDAGPKIATVNTSADVMQQLHSMGDSRLTRADSLSLQNLLG